MLKIISSLVLLLFYSCQSTSNITKELRINIASEPVTLDPGKVRHLQGFSVTSALFEGLFRMNVEGTPELAIADHYTLSEDECTYTFFLREARWNNGDRVTAQDFVYAWQRILNPEFPGSFAFSLYDIKNAQAIKKGELPIASLGVKALDTLTLEVQLERRTPYFLQLTATPPFFPINERVDRSQPSWANNAHTFVSNGPFSLSKWEHQNKIVLEKNADYWDKDSVKLSQILMAMVGDEGTELQMFERNEIDWAGSPLSVISLAAIPTLKKSNDLHTQPLCGTALIRINTERAPFDRVEVRRALSMALNRKEITEGVTHGTQIPAKSLLPQMLTLQKEALFQDGICSEVAGGLGVQEIVLSYVSLERNHVIAQAIQNQWFNAFGLQVRLEPLEMGVYYARLSKQDYQLAMGSLTADYIDPLNLLEVFKYRQGSNNTQWENQEYIRLLDGAKSALTHAERTQYLKDAESVLSDEMPIIPLYHFNMLYLKKKNLENVVLSPGGVIDFKWADIKGDS